MRFRLDGGGGESTAATGSARMTPVNEKAEAFVKKRCAKEQIKLQKTKNKMMME